ELEPFCEVDEMRAREQSSTQSVSTQQGFDDAARRGLAVRSRYLDHGERELRGPGELGEPAHRFDAGPRVRLADALEEFGIDARCLRIAHAAPPTAFVFDSDWVASMVMTTGALS